MIVCSCTGTTDRTIRALAQERTCRVEDIVRACNAGGGCGGCVEAIEMLVQCEAAGHEGGQEAKTSRTLVAAV